MAPSEGARGCRGMTTRERRPQWRTRLIALMATAAIAIPFAAGTGVSATSSLFLPYQAISLGTTDSSAVAIGDVTGDGRADVVVTGSLGFSDYRVFVLAGLANGTPRRPGLVCDRRVGFVPAPDGRDRRHHRRRAGGCRRGCVESWHPGLSAARHRRPRRTDAHRDAGQPARAHRQPRRRRGTRRRRNRLGHEHGERLPR